MDTLHPCWAGLCGATKAMALHGEGNDVRYAEEIVPQDSAGDSCVPIMMVTGPIFASHHCHGVERELTVGPSAHAQSNVCAHEVRLESLDPLVSGRLALCSSKAAPLPAEYTTDLTD